MDPAPGWNLDPPLVATVAVVVAGYATRVRTLRVRGRPVAGPRQACFYLGMATLLAALITPIDTLGESRLFWVHMVQHLMLGDLSPLLIVLGLSGPILRPVLAVPMVIRLRPLAHPLVALPLWAFNLCIWHLPVLYEAALAHPFLHGVEHLLFFATGMLMWTAVLEPLPGPAWFGSGAKAAYVLGVRALGAVLGNVFIWAGEPLYPRYAHGERLAGVSPLADQTIAGAIMFTEGAFVTLLIFAWLFLRWTREAELRQSLLDAGHEPRAAARSARYGRRRLFTAGPPSAGAEEGASLTSRARPGPRE